jgi:SAM-dependent methyltransferase
VPKELLRTVQAYGSRVPVVRGLITTFYWLRNRRDPWMRPHPFDVAYGTTTNGVLPAWLLRSGDVADSHITAYAGCQPSCLRQALTTVPNPESYTFVDLGCGKGRALILASELPFKRILGIELAPSLVSIVRRNARVIRKKHPKRTALEIVKGDATAVPLPEGDLVVFLYHPFGPELVARIVSRMIDAVAGRDRVIFFIYENPVYGDLVESTGKFARWYCENVPCTPTEIGFQPDESDTAVVWRIGGIPALSPYNGATREIVVTKPGWRAELEA